MLLLALDTAGPDCAVALARGDGERCQILVRISERIGRGHAERLMPMVEQALAAAELAFAELDRIAVTTGPGSFTGVRVGVGAARALSLALGIPAVGVGSLDALLFQLGSTEPRGTAAALLDAKRGEVYALAKDLGSGAIVFGPAAAPIDSVAAKLREMPRPLLLIGSGAPLVAAALDTADVRVVGAAESPHIAAVAALGLAADAARPVPLYLRGADAKPQADKAVARA